MQIEPQTPLPAVYQIVDPYDANRDSYYVRAVVRDSLTNSQLLFVNLESEGNGRYAAQFPAPVDGTGLGRQIDVTITVYTDSGYSVKSDMYQEIIEKWYVKAATMALAYGGSNDGDGVDYKKLRKIFEEVIAQKPEWLSDPETVDLSALSEDVKSIISAVSSIEMPDVPETDLMPVLRGISELREAVRDSIANIPEPEPVNLEPVMRAIERVGEDIAAAIQEDNAMQRDQIVSLLTEGLGGTIRDTINQGQKRTEAVRRAMEAFANGEDPELTASAKKDTPFSKFIGR